MMQLIKSVLTAIVILGLSLNSALSNPERAGQAGGDQLLINPWAASSGQAGANMANVSGYESMNLNPAGLVGQAGTEVGYSRTTWLSGSDIFINSMGFSQSLGMDDAHAIGVSLVSLDMGDFVRRTSAHPEGELGNFEPQFLNVAVGYSRLFSHAIRGGATIRVVSEQTPEVSARGVAIDAGIQYVAGEYDNMRFGIALRNVGPAMQYRGEGLAVRGSFSEADFDMTLQKRSQQFEIPSLLSIGGHYGFHLERTEEENEEGDLEESVRQELAVNASFVSNSFRHDLFNLGLEYTFKDLFRVRGGFVYEESLFSEDDRMTATAGPTAGAGVKIPLGEDLGASFEVDYSFRQTHNFNHTHNFGGRITF